MKRKLMLCLLTATAMLFGPWHSVAVAQSETANQESESRIHDAVTTARIESSFLFNEHLNPLRINTTTVNGVVTLEGEVNDEIEKELAGKIARTAEGVHEVRNNLTVNPSNDRTQKPAASDARESWRGAVNDAGITAAVKSRLAYHSGLKTLKLDVDTDGGVVSLSGNVSSEEEKVLAGRLAQQTRGVRSINNNLVVSLPTATEGSAEERAEDRAEENKDTSGDIVAAISDEWIEKHVETNLIFTSQVSMADLDVEVENGVCTITGTTISEQQKQLAGEVAAQTDGVKSVVNNIQIINWQDVPKK